MSAYIRSVTPLDPARPVMLPGEREQASAEATAGAPISVDGPTWLAIAAAARKHGIDLPKPVEG
jgi:LDH2 family malate/lactate/ureidoglycolate dehydrogenase